MKSPDDTIVAPATPPGRGAVQIVRLSGDDAARLAGALLGGQTLPGLGHHAVRTLTDPVTGAVLDQALVLYFARPNSLTGEDVVELQLHGSPVLRDEVLTMLVAAGARLAERGEFTLRAFLNGKQDLTQAEAVHDLVEARSPHALRLAAQQLAGGLSEAVARLAEGLLQLATRLEAELDFPDDVETLPVNELREALAAHIDALAEQSRSLAQGQLWRSGFRVVLVGPPNAGKSSLFNALLGRERAIVTDEAGTTRDYLEEMLPDSSHPIVLVDTAGMREAGSAAERAGIARSRQQLADASLVLELSDLTAPTEAPAPALEEPIPRWLIGTKRDLLDGPVERPEWQLSIHRPEDIQRLAARLRAEAADAFDELPPSGALTNLRQQESVVRARDLLQEVLPQLAALPRDILATQVRAALSNLTEITGHRALSETILDRIFGQFCIGK